MNGVKSLFIVDDDEILRQTLAEQLTQDGSFAVSTAGSIAEARTRLLERGERFDAIVLDISLPDGDGRDFCTELREADVKVPILMLTARDDEEDVVRGFEAGANDYVAKPFRLAEFLARLRAQIRLFASSEDAIFEIGPYVFRPARKLLQDQNTRRRIRLTEKEAAILKYLYRAGGKPVPRQELLNEVWGYNAAVTTHTLETHIYRLRQKIEADPARATLLVTESGGYRLELGEMAKAGV